MGKLANCNVTARVIRALKRAGFRDAGGTKHACMVHPDGRIATIPRHPRINPMLLRLILKQCRLTEREFIRLYR